jgi:hypothetical protein
LILVLTFGVVQIAGVGACTVLFAADRSWFISMVTVTWSAIVLLLAPFCISIDGAYSLAWLYLLSSVPSLAAQLLVVVKVIRTPPKHSQLAPHAMTTQAPLTSVEALEAGSISLPNVDTELYD